MDDTRRSNLQYNIVKDVKSKDGSSTYFVGRTTARLEDCSEDAYTIINKICDNMTHACTMWFCDRYVMDDVFTAKSKLNVAQGDVYDMQHGKDLAQERVLEKYHRQLNKKLMTFLADARELVARTEHYLEKHDIDYSDVMSVETIKETKLSGGK